MRFSALIAASAVFSYAFAEPINAIAYINNPPVTGTIHFSQESYESNTRIHINITGLIPGEHGIHIHQFGDLSQGCASTGSHYNPFNHTHGGPEAQTRHVGDFGNIIADATTGLAILNLNSSLVKLSQKTSVVGRAVVIHSGQDDLGLGGMPLSNTTGNSGDRVGCGVIGYSSVVS
ncbi:copper/zinc superoxide dismutase [Sporodiniella umbellata]|nr:copper/zinc superoxide dismutase [Sporodiniella umbellata]